MNPEKRTLLVVVRLEDVVTTDLISRPLMGEDVESRAEVYRREHTGGEQPGRVAGCRPSKPKFTTGGQVIFA